MDAIDRKIVRALQENARLSNQDLSARVGLSPSPCLRRVRALEKRGVLSGYTAQVDQEQYGLPLNVFVEIKLERPSDDIIRRFEAGIARADEILECYLMTGSSDYMLHVVSSSLQDYEYFIRNVLTKLPGVHSIDSKFAFGKVKKNTVFPKVM
jgi:Lrp/AsnC family transcriptional regulator, leucine-responsive regulatory protein